MRNRIFAVLLAFLLVLLGSGSAYAADYPVYNPGEGLNDYGNDHYMLAPVSNAFNAALWLMGENDKYPQLTDAQLALLSNEDTGGAFYDLALKFSSVADQGYPSWSDASFNISSWGIFFDFRSAVSSYGGSHVWYVTADNADIQNARRDFLKVYNGESTGGGGSYSDTIFTYYWPAPQSYSTIFKTDYTFCPREVSANVSLISSQVTFTCPSSLFANVPVSEYDRVWVFDRSSNNYRCYCLERGSYSITSETFSYGDSAYITKGKLTWTKTGYLCNGWKTSNTSGSFSSKLTFDGSVLGVDIPDDAVFTSINAVAPSNVTVNYGWIGSSYYAPPVNHWPEPTPPQPQPEPDPPEVPQPPELPTPWNPTIPEPDPPSPINPYTPIVEPEPTGTTPNDYTPWLRAILAALNRIIVDLATHCQHIQNAIRNASSYIVTAIGDYVEYLAGKLHYDLTTIIADLESYLADLAQWLADELDFDRDAQVYDDARLMRILLDIRSRLGDLDSAISDLSAQLGDIYVRLGQILAKIGSGGGGRPAPTTEPEVDEGFDFWQWLLDLISSKLDGIIDDFVGDIGGFLSELVTKFPFSIPWDIAAYLTLLDSQRVTPVISFVIPAIGGWWGEVPITVDLQPYDNAMAAVRSMMLILWGFCLIMRTDWLGGVFDGATKAVTSFFDRLTGHGGGD